MNDYIFESVCKIHNDMFTFLLSFLLVIKLHESFVFVSELFFYYACLLILNILVLYPDVGLVDKCLIVVIMNKMVNQ